jgi:hypothetical protein
MRSFNNSWNTLLLAIVCLGLALSDDTATEGLKLQPILPNPNNKVFDRADPSIKPPSEDLAVASNDEAAKELVDSSLIINKRCFKKGMTFALGARDNTFGIQKFVCRGMPLNDNGSMNCGQFYGDTWCFRKRRVLCINKLKLNRPAYTVAPNSPINEGWTEGIVQASPPVIGCSFATKQDVDAYCTKLFGCGYVLADFHDGRYMNGMNGAINANFSWNSAITFKGFNNFWTYVQGAFMTSQRFWVSHTDVFGANPSCWV